MSLSGLSRSREKTLLPDSEVSRPLTPQYLAELPLRLSASVEENAEIKGMDINPLIACKNGAVAVDARIIVDNKGE